MNAIIIIFFMLAPQIFIIHITFPHAPVPILFSVHKKGIFSTFVEVYIVNLKDGDEI